MSTDETHPSITFLSATLCQLSLLFHEYSLLYVSYFRVAAAETLKFIWTFGSLYFGFYSLFDVLLIHFRIKVCYL